MKSTFLFSCLWGTVWIYLFCLGCSPTGDEPSLATVPMLSDSWDNANTVINDEGWEISIDRFDVCVENIEFTVEGETHVSLVKKLSDIVIPPAMAHPGHLAGGDVTGTLDGQWVIAFVGESVEVGDAQLLEGIYNGFNLNFCIAAATHGIASDAPILGHNAYVHGYAQKSMKSISFELFLDITDDAQMLGGVFEMTVSSGSAGSILLRPLVFDVVEGETLFDGLNIGDLDEDADNVVTLVAGQAAHNIIMKSFISHDFWSVVPMSE